MEPHGTADKQEAHRQLTSRLRRQMEEIRRLTSGLNEDTLAKRMLEGKWSLKELVCHLWRVQRVFDGRVMAMLEQENPEIEPYEPDADEQFDKMLKLRTEDMARQMIQDRERLLARLEPLSAAEWHRPGTHPEFPHYDVHFQIEYMMHHEAHHIYQMFQRRALLGKIPH